MHTKINSEILKELKADDDFDLTNQIKECKQICFEDFSIYFNIMKNLKPADIKVTESLLTDKYAKFSESISETQAEIESVNKSIEELEVCK